MNSTLPITQIVLCGLTALSILTSVLVYVLLQSEVTRLRRRVDAAQKEQEAALLERAAEIASLQETVERLRRNQEERAVPISEPGEAPTGRGLNRTRRSQVLRRFREGERPEQIANTLGVPLNEVKLVQKVQQMLRASCD